MPIETLMTTEPNGANRRKICVVAQQAYYLSTGHNSGMRGIWLPFEGINPQALRLEKPNIAGTRAKIQDHFPPGVSIAIQDSFTAVGEELGSDKWGRFKNMHCLYVSCLLSQAMMDVRIKKALRQYVGQQNLGEYDVLKLAEPKESRALTEDTFQFINNWLINRGAAEIAVASQVEFTELLNNLEALEDDKDNFTDDDMANSYPETITDELFTFIRDLRVNYALDLIQLPQQSTESVNRPRPHESICSRSAQVLSDCCLAMWRHKRPMHTQEERSNDLEI